MHSSGLYLHKVSFRSDRLFSYAQARKTRTHSLDDGYVAHCALRELWQELAPSPFVVQMNGRRVNVWGYSRADTAALTSRSIEKHNSLARPLIDAFSTIESKPVPIIPNNRRVGFVLRACPVVRLWRDISGYSAGAEVDAYLARSFALGTDQSVSREEVYRDWLSKKLEARGIRALHVEVSAYRSDLFTRRTQGEIRNSALLTRPDVHFKGELHVEDGNRLLECLSHGIGRHKAFGFGAMLLTTSSAVSPF